MAEVWALDEPVEARLFEGEKEPLRLYHTTTWPNARAIVSGGFKDAENSWRFLSDRPYGMWLADRPLHWGDVGWQADDLAVLTVKIPKRIVKPFEVEEELLRYRGFHLPAEVVNRYPVLDVRSIRDYLGEGRLAKLARLIQGILKPSRPRGHGRWRALPPRFRQA